MSEIDTVPYVTTGGEAAPWASVIQPALQKIAPLVRDKVGNFVHFTLHILWMRHNLAGNAWDVMAIQFKTK